MIQLSNIQNIIFDLGGVIINLDYEKTTQAFSSLCKTDFSKVYTQHQQAHFFDAFEKGKLSAQDFRNQIRHHWQIEAPDDRIDEAWNAMLLDIPIRRIQTLRRLASTYRIFLLSNTNEIHKKAFDAIIWENYPQDTLEDIFEKCYYSHEIGMRKPDTEIFEFVTSQHQLRLEETLFIDDTIRHIYGAQETGLHTFHINKEICISSLF